jgi:hypothetical protein
MRYGFDYVFANEASAVYKKARAPHRCGASDMFDVILGMALIGAGVGSFWYLLPRNGQVHPVVENSNVGSMITILIMAVLTAGVGFIAVGLSG